MRARGLVVLLVCVGAVAAACGGSGSHTTTASLHPSSDGCDHTKPAAASLKRASFTKPGSVLKPGEAAAIDMVTSCGALTIQLDSDTSNPIPNSIAFLVSKHFYDGLSIFRAVPDFVLQGGDPNDNGTGGPGYQVVGKVPPGYQYKVGDVAMAKTAAAPNGSGGSQFFLISGAQGAALPPQYGLLGHAADKASLATIARLAKFSTSTEQPSKPLYIWSAKLVRD
jgi:cyclophilin family peptidyl-prolyl cis-trans isomerase